MNGNSWRVRCLASSALILLAVVIGTACSKAPGLDKLVTDMVAAHNRHDVTRQLAFFTDDAVFVISGQTPVTGKTALRGLYGADSVMKSELVYADLVVHGDTVIINSVVERNDLLRLLGVEEMHYLPGTRVVFENGLIKKIEASRLDQKDWRTMRDNFSALMNWLQTTHPELLKEIGSGRLAGNNATAARGWLDLAAEWRQSQAAQEN